MLSQKPHDRIVRQRGKDAQMTGRWGLRHKEWSVFYENDMHGDMGDRYRSAAASINYNGKYGDHGIGVNIYTTMATSGVSNKFDMRSRDNRSFWHRGHRYYAGGRGLEATLYYRNGNNYFGFSHPAFGHIFQNVIAHDLITRGETARFQWGPNGYGGGKCYVGPVYFYKSFNPYTLW